MKTKFLLMTLFLGLELPALAADVGPPDLPKHELQKSANGALVVGNCDGETSIEIPGKKEGEKPTDAEARLASKQLMEAWRKKNPRKPWILIADQAKQPQKGPSLSKTPKQDPVSAAGQAQRDEVTKQQGIYQNYTKADEKIWETELANLIETGNQIFHSAEKLGSKTAISCDMCHPNAANTHPETYPKFQVQIQRMAMLRDMINWCIENPVKGPMLRDEDPRMKALEAYIISQRKGVALAPGKH